MCPPPPVPTEKLFGGAGCSVSWLKPWTEMLRCDRRTIQSLQPVRRSFQITCLLRRSLWLYLLLSKPKIRHIASEFDWILMIDFMDYCRSPAVPFAADDLCVCVCVRKSHDIKAQYRSGLFVFVSFVFVLIFPTYPRIIVACWGWGALMRGVSWMKSAKRRSVKIHRERSAACVVYYDMHHMAACHWTWRGNPNSPLW